MTRPDGSKAIEVEPNHAPYVIKMFELYATGIHSFKTIAGEMNKLGLKNANGNPVLPSKVELVLKNTFYFGLMKVKSEYYPHKYEPLISEHLFDKAQEVMAGHNKSPVQYAGKPILLRGLITCEHCGCAVTGDIKKEKYIYYSCNNSRGICSKKWIREGKLLEKLLIYFDKIQLPDTFIGRC